MIIRRHGNHYRQLPNVSRARNPQGESTREPIQHAISQLGFFTEYTSSWLIEVREAAASLEETREKPHVLTDGDVDRIRRVYTDQAGDFDLFEDTATRWRAQGNLTPQERTGLETLDGSLIQLRQLNTSVQELADSLETRTLDRVLATPDIELGLNMLLAHGRGERPTTMN